MAGLRMMVDKESAMPGPVFIRASACIIGWLDCADIRHKIAHYSLASWPEGSVHPVMAALLPPDVNGEGSGEIKEGIGVRAVERRAWEQRKAGSNSQV